MKKCAFICNCGYGTIFEKEITEHVLKAHNIDATSMVKGVKTFWWTNIPTYNKMFYCHYCKFKTPFNALKTSHKCIDFAQVTEMPTSPVWKSFIGNGIRPFCESGTEEVAGKPLSQPPPTRQPFEVDMDDCIDFGVLKIKEGCYKAYSENTFQNDAVQRGFFCGKNMKYAAMVITDAVLHTGSFWITDIHGQVAGEACVTLHFSNLLGDNSAVSFTGHNPAGLPFVADMISLETRPFMCTHHLAVDAILDEGEYRMTDQRSGKQPNTMKIWFKDAGKD